MPVNIFSFLGLLSIALLILIAIASESFLLILDVLEKMQGGGSKWWLFGKNDIITMI